MPQQNFECLTSILVMLSNYEIIPNFSVHRCPCNGSATAAWVLTDPALNHFGMSNDPQTWLYKLQVRTGDYWG